MRKISCNFVIISFPIGISVRNQALHVREKWRSVSTQLTNANLFIFGTFDRNMIPVWWVVLTNWDDERLDNRSMSLTCPNSGWLSSNTNIARQCEYKSERIIGCIYFEIIMKHYSAQNISKFLIKLYKINKLYYNSEKMSLLYIDITINCVCAHILSALIIYKIFYINIERNYALLKE